MGQLEFLTGTGEANAGASQASLVAATDLTVLVRFDGELITNMTSFQTLILWESTDSAETNVKASFYLVSDGSGNVKLVIEKSDDGEATAFVARTAFSAGTGYIAQGQMGNGPPNDDTRHYCAIFEDDATIIVESAQNFASSFPTTAGWGYQRCANRAEDLIGKIDCIAVYSDNIAKAHTVKPTTADANIISLYYMDEASGATIPNAVAGAEAMTLTGSESTDYQWVSGGVWNAAGPVEQIGSDAVTGTDTGVVAAVGTGNDASTIGDSGAVVAEVQGSDTVAVADAGTVDGSGTHEGGDSGTVADTGVIAATLTAADAITVAESVALALTGRDQVTVGDQVALDVTAVQADIVTVTEDEDEVTIDLDDAEGQVQESAAIGAAIQGSETDTVTDTGQVVAEVQASDSVTVSDSGTAQAPGSPVGADSGTVDEQAAIVAVVVGDDAIAPEFAAAIDAVLSATTDEVTVSEGAVVEVTLTTGETVTWSDAATAIHSQFSGVAQGTVAVAPRVRGTPAISGSTGGV